MVKKKKINDLTVDEVEELPDFKRMVYCYGHKGKTEFAGDIFMVQVRVDVVTRALLDVIKERAGISYGKIVRNILQEYQSQIIEDLQVYGGNLGADIEEAVAERAQELLKEIKDGEGAKKAC